MGLGKGNLGVIVVRVCEPVFRNLSHSFTRPLKKQTHSYTRLDRLNKKKKTKNKKQKGSVDAFFFFFFLYPLMIAVNSLSTKRHAASKNL